MRRDPRVTQWKCLSPALDSSRNPSISRLADATPANLTRVTETIMSEQQKTQTTSPAQGEAEIQDLPAIAPRASEQDAVRAGFVMRSNKASPVL
jgi:hypothetical protein